MTLEDARTSALESRDEVGQAKGILMERFSLSAEQALALLVRSSQDTNVKLAEVARFLTAQIAAGSDQPPAPGQER